MKDHRAGAAVIVIAAAVTNWPDFLMQLLIVKLLPNY